MSNYLVCDVGNPLPADHEARFTISMRLEGVYDITDSELLFSFNVNSNYAADENAFDNVFNCKF